ncbi:pre-mRNA-splicing factor srp2 [Trichoderma asperellum]|uniref:Pre-mRNA-splicing factor srp2 n=1 Tax=Trichoderma asperellum TaxID=101201 RepID=A0A6V8QRG5_TRIAP|nr:pre-mRNA-splicing factor srp2 [Trichoderma asperellum]
MTEVSSTRLYLGNLPRNATKADVEAHFATHGTGEITEVKLMNGFGFIEYKDAMDARDVVPDGSDFMGERLTVQFARGARHREGGMGHERAPPRPRRTPHRMQITGLPNDTSWQDLKDFARQSSLDVVYSETGRDSNGRGFVEFETAADLRTAVEKLDGREFKGARVQCLVDTQPEMPPRDPRGRSRSPGPAKVVHRTATVTEALAVTTMMTGHRAIVHPLAGQWKITRHLEAAMMSLTAAIIHHLLPTPMSTAVDLPMTGHQETFLLGSQHTLEKDMRETTIVVDVTGKSSSPLFHLYLS